MSLSTNNSRLLALPEDLFLRVIDYLDFKSTMRLANTSNSVLNTKEKIERLRLIADIWYLEPDRGFPPALHRQLGKKGYDISQIPKTEKSFSDFFPDPAATNQKPADITHVLMQGRTPGPFLLIKFPQYPRLHYGYPIENSRTNIFNLIKKSAKQLIAKRFEIEPKIYEYWAEHPPQRPLIAAKLRIKKESADCFPLQLRTGSSESLRPLSNGEVPLVQAPQRRVRHSLLTRIKDVAAGFFSWLASKISACFSRLSFFS